MQTQPERTMVIWWRLGKEHGEEDFRANPKEVIDANLDDKVTHFGTTPDSQWRWWTVNQELIVERPEPNEYGYGSNTRIFYLPSAGMTIIEDIDVTHLRDQWKWYVHIADIYYDAVRNCWINKDLFCDILVAPDGRTHQVVDLDDLGVALTKRIVTPEEVSDILHRTNLAIDLISLGGLPLPEMGPGPVAFDQLGWNR
ncbi:MAG: hypothetical protein HOH43_19490 [Candidatus Latescibacteria bacterium]|nr:hypothetical protein [Candidatus Latescibacterota bacterium]